MAPTPSPEPGGLAEAERRALLGLARRSIEHGLAQGQALEVDPGAYPPPLQEDRATFVTLQEEGRLRGCIGHLEAIQPLARDVCENAYAAAFRDPRFPPLEAWEPPLLRVEISVLSPAEPLSFASEEELLGLIEPGRDGLILTDGPARGTFLPSVWETLPDPREFLRHLKRKAGLSTSHWSDTLQVHRYRTESFHD